MNNYHGTPFNEQNIYANTYSLWENSAYYDINNLSPQNFSSSWHRSNDEDFETRFTSGPTEPMDVEPPDHRNRRTICKSSLYNDPETFYQNITGSSLFSWGSFISSSNLESPHLESQSESQKSQVGRKEHVGPNMKFQKKLDKMFAKPVTMSKAESMMQKMGWEGGPLGRGTTGIVEPIRPNAVYATDRIGFGKPTPKCKSNVNKKTIFITNVLYNLLEFVKNNNVVELLFDCKLNNDERKRIHGLVDRISNNDTESFENDAQKEIVLAICDFNCYILSTESEGQSPDRKICVYKEAPVHVYLIIPDDFREDPPTEEQPLAPPTDNEVEEETNPFLISITRNLKKKDDEKALKTQAFDQPKEEVSLSNKILEFFMEFGQKKQFSQFKFLGPFSKEEQRDITDFLDNAALYLNGHSCKYSDVFNKTSFYLAQDVTGNSVINKRIE